MPVVLAALTAPQTPETPDMTIFRCPSEASVLLDRDAIADHLACHGYAMIEAWDAESGTLRAIAERFGRIQSHIRADAKGLVGISTDTVGQSRVGEVPFGISRCQQ